MIEFQAKDPFPLLSIDNYSYADAKRHAELVDQWLGLLPREQLIQARTDQQNWRHLPLQTLMTPYLEIRSSLALLEPRPGHLILDLGCAYGRMAHVIGRHYPETSFIGYELESHRAEEGQRLLQNFSYNNVRLVCQDLKSPDFQLPQADCYFIYDFGSPEVIDKMIDSIRDHARHRHIQVIARGRSTRQILHQHHPWLTEVNQPQHYLNFSIYSS